MTRALKACEKLDGSCLPLARCGKRAPVTEPCCAHQAVAQCGTQAFVQWRHGDEYIQTQVVGLPQQGVQLLRLLFAGCAQRQPWHARRQVFWPAR